MYNIAKWRNLSQRRIVDVQKKAPLFVNLYKFLPRFQICTKGKYHKENEIDFRVSRKKEKDCLNSIWKSIWNVWLNLNLMNFKSLRLKFRACSSENQNSRREKERKLLNLQRSFLYCFVFRRWKCNGWIKKRIRQ